MSFADRIREAAEKAANRADRVARRVVTVTRSRTMQGVSKVAGIERFRWRTRGDGRVRKAHRDINGQIYRWDEGGHPTEGIPGVTAYACRCTPEPVLANVR